MSEPQYFDIKKIGQIFNFKPCQEDLLKKASKKIIPDPIKVKKGIIQKIMWEKSMLPEIGKSHGFIKKWSKPICISVFTTKGGVLKTTMALNLARICALHGLRTCVVGLDMQGDITTALGHNIDLEKQKSIDEIIHKINETKGLTDYFNGNEKLEGLILKTDLPTLFYIPETPELAALNESLNLINRREYWLKEKVITPLKRDFDVILCDCSPNWNKLITNALVSSDILVSPIECKINNFRNFRLFKYFLGEFVKEMNLNLINIFVPTRYANNRKLSMDICHWYRTNLKNCTHEGIRESTLSEEAQAMQLSLLEYAPNKKISQEMRGLIMEIQSLSEGLLKDKKASLENGLEFNSLN